jgi:hypothetical protein
MSTTQNTSYSYVGKSAPKIEARRKLPDKRFTPPIMCCLARCGEKFCAVPIACADNRREYGSRKSACRSSRCSYRDGYSRRFNRRRLRDMPMLANDRVRFIGEKVAW